MDPMDQNDSPADDARLGLRYAALSDVGRVRKDNQDSGFASPHLLVIADGVGGAARGDIASSTAVQALRRLDGPAPDDLLEALAGAIHRAHDRIAELVEQDPELDGTSTTVTAALFDGSRVGVAHIGDSRGYLLRDGTLAQITKDHTFVQSLIDEGRITEDESRTHPHRNLILRAVDGVHETDPDLFYIELVPGDRMLLCSDGCLRGARPRTGSPTSSGPGPRLCRGRAHPRLARGRQHRQHHLSWSPTWSTLCDRRPPTRRPRPLRRPIRSWWVPPPSSHAAPARARRASSAATGEVTPARSSRCRARARPTGRAVDPEELRYAPRAPRRGRRPADAGRPARHRARSRRRGRARLPLEQDQYYVSATTDRVAIFQGVQADMPGLSLQPRRGGHRRDHRRAARLHAEQVRSGIPADTPTDARQIVSRLTSAARGVPERRRRHADHPDTEAVGDPDEEAVRHPRGAPAATEAEAPASTRLAHADTLARRWTTPARGVHRGRASMSAAAGPRRGLHAPQTSRRGAVPARPRPGRRRGRLRGGRSRRRGDRARRHRRLRRLAGRALHRLPRRGAVRRAVRRPGAAPDRHRPQRSRARGHPPHRPGKPCRQQRREDVRSWAAHLDDAWRGALRGGARGGPRPPQAAGASPTRPASPRCCCC